MSTATLIPPAATPPTEIAGIPAPRFFLGAIIMFWGWQNQQWGLALGMALLVESAPWLRRVTGISWQFADKDFNRIADLTTLGWILTAIYFFNQSGIDGLFLLLNGFPLLLFLLLLAQLYSTHRHLPLSALFWSLRRVAQQAQTDPMIDTRLLRLRLDLSHPYAVLCLLSASVAQQPSFWLGVLVFFAWGLWHVRPRRYHPAIWLSVLLLTCGLGYLGQQGIQQFQQQLEHWVLEWFEEQLWRSRDPYRQNTRIGDIGTLKQSNQILFRVKAAAPLLLHEASYHHYKQQNWQARQVNFVPLANTTEALGWQLYPHPPNTDVARLSISLYLNQGRGMLPLPANSLRLYALGGLEIQRNQIDGALKIDKAPSLLNYEVNYALSALPVTLNHSDNFLSIPAREEAVLEQLATELNLRPSLKPQSKIQNIKQFFDENFKYSLVQKENPSFATPLSHFLLTQRQGHCEYFATATTLLLRKAGIPSRYMVGYAVQEYSALEKAYVVRRRHAHAWAQAYVDGRWQDVDTTPSDWVAAEAEAAGHWHGVSDIWAWLTYHFNQWRWRQSKEEDRTLLWWLVPLFILLLWRLSLHKKYQRNTTQTAPAPSNKVAQGQDSPFYAVFQNLQKQGYVYHEGQSLHHWLEQIQRLNITPIEAKDELSLLLAQHNRYRFHPQSLNAEQHQRFKQAVEQWLKQQKPSPPECQK